MYTETSDITLKGVHANKVRTLNDEGAFLHASDCAVILEDSHFMFVGNLSALLIETDSSNTAELHIRNAIFEDCIGEQGAAIQSKNINT